MECFVTAAINFSILQCIKLFRIAKGKAVTTGLYLQKKCFFNPQSITYLEVNTEETQQVALPSQSLPLPNLQSVFYHPPLSYDFIFKRKALNSD